MRSHDEPGDWIPSDSVDALIADWADRRPGLDVTSMGVLTRLARVRRHVEVELERVFAAHGLVPGTFALLATLDRRGGPVPAVELTEALGVPVAVIESRVDELVALGLAVQSEAGMELTETGRTRAAAVVPAHLDNQRRLLQALEPAEREQLATLLRKLLGEYEGSRPLGDAAPVLGITVAPAHLTGELREAVGLPPAYGLLVRVVDHDGPAARGGLRTGDVLLCSGKRALLSVAALRAAVAGAAGRELHLRVLRGAAEELDLTLRGFASPPDAASPGRAAFAEHVI